MAKIKVRIDGIDIEVEEGTTVINAAYQAGVKIPTLCYLKGLNEIGACRICLCEVSGARGLVAACVYPLNADPRFEVIEVKTNTPQIREYRKRTIELILSDHKKECLSCIRNGNCELAELSNEYNCDFDAFKGGEVIDYPIDTTSAAIVRDNNKCVLCRRCVAACREYQSVSVIGPNARGFYTHIGCTFEKDLGDTNCVNCGQCIVACPTGALHEKDQVEDVLKALADPNKYVVVGTAPSVRVGLGEEFGLPIGTNVEGKMASALRRIGFKNVFNVNFTADLTIMEEGTEFIGRVKNGGVLPMLTSCSPAWIKFMEHNFPDQLDHLSSCKSPQGMFGAICKTYLAEKLGIDPKNMVVVSIMPCTAKKFEAGRPYMNAAGAECPDIDYALTTRELARMIKKMNIVFEALPDGKFDTPFGIGSGAGLIFGATGGVMEAALRSVYAILAGEEAPSLDFKDVRGTQGIKEATYEVPIKGGKPIKVNIAVASGLANARKLMDEVKAGTSKYHFIEVMSCPGGCVNGGGQPIKPAYVRNTKDIKEIRANTIYKMDKSYDLRVSHKNPEVLDLYKEYFGEPNSHKAHEILHTKYIKRDLY